MAGALGLQVARERYFPSSERAAQRMLYVPSGPALARLSLSFDALVADLYWIRTIQHYGGDRLSQRGESRYELLYPLLDITTALDPRFTIAYRFGAIFLSEPWPGGPGRPDQAVKLLEKGLAAEPHKWQYAYEAGFVFYRLGRYRDAASWFRRASEIQQAPEWLGPLAAATLARGGDRDVSRFLWQQIRASAEEDWMRQTAERNLVQLDTLDHIATLQPLVDRYAREHPDGPLTWERLIAAGVFPGIPLDLTKTPYGLNPWWGTIVVAEQSPLFPMPGDLQAEPPGS
jgi:tetratricopeptide (TPR) repeat protein